MTRSNTSSAASIVASWSSSFDPKCASVPTVATPGEFRLGPGLAQPPGYVGAPKVRSGDAPGEFRLGPGLAQPPGYGDSAD